METKDESFHTIDCAGTDNQTQTTPETQKINRKNALVNKTSYTFIWYAYYNLHPGNGAAPILTAPEPTRGYITKCKVLKNTLVSRAAYFLPQFTHW